MRWNRWMRRLHRWLSVIFTLAVITNFAVMGREPLAMWVGAATLLPLALLLITGLYLFVLPYTARRRGEQGAGG